jgi:hypothetical protein
VTPTDLRASCLIAWAIPVSSFILLLKHLLTLMIQIQTLLPDLQPPQVVPVCAPSQGRLKSALRDLVDPLRLHLHSVVPPLQGLKEGPLRPLILRQPTPLSHPQSIRPTIASMAFLAPQVICGHPVQASTFLILETLVTMMTMESIPCLGFKKNKNIKRPFSFLRFSHALFPSKIWLR